MGEREHRGLSSNSKSRRRGIFDKYKEHRYGSSGTDESVLQYTSRSYEELRARDEELFYKDDEDWTFITEEEYQAKATNKSQNKSETEQIDVVNLSTAEKLTESSEKSVTPPLNVVDLSSAEKLGEAMKRAALKLPKALGEQLLAMVNPASLATMVGVLGAYAASHAVGIGIIADAVMAVSAGALIGWQAVTAAKDLWGFAQFVNATTEEELDKAGQHLASFVATVGIDIVLGILTKRAASKAKNYGDDLNRVDEVSAHSEDAGRVNGVDNTRSANTDSVKKEFEVNAPAKVEGKTYFREVEIIDSQGTPVGEFDEIDLQNKIFYEDKQARGLNVIDPRTGKPAQTPEKFVDKQIIKKTRKRIKNIINSADSTRPTKNGTPNVPDLNDIKDIKKFVFRMEGDTPQLRKAVENGIINLRNEFPDYEFDAEFGV